MILARVSAILATLLASLIAVPTTAATGISWDIVTYSIEVQEEKNDNRVLHHVEASNGFRIFHPRILKDKASKRGAVNLEACFDGPNPNEFVYTVSNDALGYFDAYDEVSPYDWPSDVCHGQGNDKIYCDWSDIAYTEDHTSYEDCMSDPDYQWVILTGTYFDFDDDVTLIFNLGVCNPKACDAKAVLKVLSHPVTTFVKEVENGPKQNEGTLDDCLVDGDTIEELVELNADLYQAAFFANLNDSYSFCEERKKNTIYCDNSSDPYFASERLACLDEDKQWVVAKITAKDHDDDVTVILDNGGKCLPRTCDAKKLAKKLSSPVTYDLKKIDGGRLRSRMK